MPEENELNGPFLKSNVEKRIPRDVLTVDYLKELASSDDETSIHIFDEDIGILRGKPDQVEHVPKLGEKPSFKLHSHPEHGGDQPSIADLNSAELYQLYDENPGIRFFIFTVRGLTEYRLPKSIISFLDETGDEFRDYYSKWIKKTYKDDKPDGKTISTDFNKEHDTHTFYPWDSEHAFQLVQEFRNQKTSNETKEN